MSFKDPFFLPVLMIIADEGEFQEHSHWTKRGVTTATLFDEHEFQLTAPVEPGKKYKEVIQLNNDPVQFSMLDGNEYTMTSKGALNGIALTDASMDADGNVTHIYQNVGAINDAIEACLDDNDIQYSKSLRPKRKNGNKESMEYRVKGYRPFVGRDMVEFLEAAEGPPQNAYMYSMLMYMINGDGSVTNGSRTGYFVKGSNKQVEDIFQLLCFFLGLDTAIKYIDRKDKSPERRVCFKDHRMYNFVDLGTRVMESVDINVPEGCRLICRWRENVYY